METKSRYGLIFNSSCAGWDQNREFNVMYLEAQQNYFNDILRQRGYVFLRDILENIGFPVTKSSLSEGWYYDLNDTYANNYIDFGIHVKEDGINIELNFNVDGDITNRFKD